MRLEEHQCRSSADTDKGSGETKVEFKKASYTWGFRVKDGLAPIKAGPPGAAI